MKKKFFLSLILVLTIYLSGKAQTQKGNKLIGGGGSVSFNEPFSIELNPRFGYFIINNLALGAQLPLYYSDGITGYPINNIRILSLGLSPFVRYYFGDVAKTRVFVGAFGGISKNWHNSERLGGSKRTSTSNNIGLDLGVVHFITDQVGLEVTLNYYNKIGSSYFIDTRINRLILNLGFQIFLPASSK